MDSSQTGKALGINHPGRHGHVICLCVLPPSFQYRRKIVLGNGKVMRTMLLISRFGRSLREGSRTCLVFFPRSAQERLRAKMQRTLANVYERTLPLTTIKNKYGFISFVLNPVYLTFRTSKPYCDTSESLRSDTPQEPGKCNSTTRRNGHG